ncbi:MAG: efflux RND transporter permease subunit [Acidobacteria bacterium]|nr:efflux RND transporter permease subunit [Acidobacteriota bacterium]MBI3426643.1 efflux RND transporter permease subunit [Acidobacteriota bacterium]
MWIVKLALRRPYTFVVAALLIGLLGGVTIVRMSTDIFPEIDLPVASVIWTYNGISAEEMAQRIVTPSERGLTTTVNDIEHIESQSLNGVAVIKVFFHPGAKIEAAVAQITAMSQSILRIMPPGSSSPFIVRYNVSNVPILQASVSSDALNEQQLYDYSQNFIRTQMATVQGASLPIPYGGKPRQIMVDIDAQALYAKGLSASDVSAAINAQNLILPAGTAKMGNREYNVRLNSSPESVEALNDLPIKQVGNATVYLREVAHVRDGSQVQTNIVRADGRRSALLTVLKSGGASTLDIVSRVKAALPKIMSTVPKELKVNLLFDQSVFVRAAINGVMVEALIAACLTAAMILLFLGSWRSTLIVTISIPLSILCSIITLSLLGETLNVMTLGGLALAVGILVDDATVEIENIHRNLGQGKALKQAILDGAQQIAVPAFVSTLAICIVFVPVVFLSGAAKSMFTPLAMAVVFAMLASYLLSRTLIPTMVMYLLRDEAKLYHGEGEFVDESHGLIGRVHNGFNEVFERLRERYQGALEWALAHRRIVVFGFLAFCLGSFILLPFIGEDFFPAVDAGQFRLHVRTPAGTRLEETERIFGQVEDAIRRLVPREELELVLDNIGLPSIGINLAYSDSATVSLSDGEILVALKEKHQPTRDYVKRLRRELKRQFPELTFFFQPADIVSQILNFGLPAPIDIQIVGRDQKGNYEIARQLEQRVSRIPGAADVHLHQVVDQPELRVNVDRTRAEQVGLSQRDVAGNLLTALSSSVQTAPNYWLNPENGVNYIVAVQMPQYKMDSVAALQNTPITGSNGAAAPQLLSNLAEVEHSTALAVVNHYNVQPTYDVYANVQGRDLGGVARAIDRVLAEFQPKLPRGSTIVMRGQIESMRSSFVGLAFGLLFAVLLVYFLMVVNFQSWLDPFIILMALPGALAGILWMLFVTQTTISVPSLMGAIMCVGVATANSILLVTFANDQRLAGVDAINAALAAGFTRLRPVLMTALAMVIGMLPMSLGWGEGGEQNAPLGRAVIGGLLIATFATLFFVPVVYSVLRHRPVRQPEAELEPLAVSAFSGTVPPLHDLLTLRN